MIKLKIRFFSAQEISKSELMTDKKIQNLSFGLMRNFRLCVFYLIESLEAQVLYSEKIQILMFLLKKLLTDKIDSKIFEEKFNSLFKYSFQYKCTVIFASNINYMFSSLASFQYLKKVNSLSCVVPHGSAFSSTYSNTW